MPFSKVTAFCVVLCWTLPAEEPSKPRPSLKQRMIGKPALIGAGVSTVVGYISDSPEEWGRGVAGIGKRFGSAMGRHLVKGSVQFGVAAWRHEELMYQPSDQSGFGPRIRHALLSTVIT